MEMAVDDDIARHEAEPGDLREETDIDVEPVAPGLEQDRETAVGEVRAFLLRENRVEPRLHRRSGHSRVEDQHVRAKTGIASRT